MTTWEQFYEFNWHHTAGLSAPCAYCRSSAGRTLDWLAQELAAHEPTAVVADQTPTAAVARRGADRRPSRSERG